MRPSLDPLRSIAVYGLCILAGVALVSGCSPVPPGPREFLPTPTTVPFAVGYPAEAPAPSPTAPRPTAVPMPTPRPASTPVVAVEPAAPTALPAASPTPSAQTGRVPSALPQSPGGQTPAPAPTVAAQPEVQTGTAVPPASAGTSPAQAGDPAPVAASSPPTLLHAVAGREQCSACHTVGGAGVGASGGTGMATSHQGRADATCLSCHAAPASTSTQAPAPVKLGPRIEHTLDGRSDCTRCHVPEGNKPPSGGKTMPKDHQGRTSETCSLCHQPKR